MAQIYYQINSGYPNFTAHIEPNVASDQTHSSTGVYSFDDVPAGDYSITITDGIGCEAFFDNINIVPTTTTTTTTIYVECTSYGMLYNELSIENINNIAPEGYRVCLLSDVVDLVNYLGGETIAGGKLKALNYWESPNTGATNESGFSALPSGTRLVNGDFVNILLRNNIWISNK